ncbi:MAG: CapA family protein [Sphingomonadales bacterium]|nr:MAG: CapA family protein [Sphingomonadales bacterium]
MKIARRLILMAACAALLPIGPAIGGDKKGQQPAPVRVLLTGDVSFGENYQADAAAKGRVNILDRHGYDYTIQRLAPLLARADYTIVNLETPLTDMPRSPLADSGKDYLHWSHVDKAPARLAAYGVDAAGLANNHTLDFGQQGLLDTFASLNRYGITAFGAGRDADEAAAPLVRVLRVGNREVTIGVIASFERRASYVKHGFYAGADTPGTNPTDTQAIAAQVKELRRRNPGILILSYAHWGSNYAWRSADQQTAARAMIDAGVDVVVGHHGHMLQEVERYRDKWIIYGLGNFMFNANGRFAAFPEAVPYGLAMELVFADNGKAVDSEIRLYAVRSDNLKTGYQPSIADKGDADAAFGEMLRRSALGGDAGLARRGADQIGPFLRLTQIRPPAN